MPNLPALLALAGTLTLVQVEWKPEYAATPQVVQDWYRNAELTEAAQRRFPFKSCCSHSDVVRTKFQVNRTDAGDEWYWLDGGKWRRVPPDIIHWGEKAPRGEAVLFVFQGVETCFWPPEGGL